MAALGSGATLVSLAAIPVGFSVSVRAYRSRRDPIFAALAFATLVAVVVILVKPLFN